MACWEGKKYKLSKSENFDEYMKALGVGMVLRKMGNTASPVVELTKDGDEYTLTTSTTFKTTTIKFKPSVEFTEETADGRSIKSTCKFETPEKLVHEQTGDKPGTIIREFTADGMVATMTLDSITCVREYKAV